MSVVVIGHYVICLCDFSESSFDIGPLLMQAKYAVPEHCTALQLRDYLALEGSSLVRVMVSHSLLLWSLIPVFILVNCGFLKSAVLNVSAQQPLIP